MNLIIVAVECDVCGRRSFGRPPDTRAVLVARLERSGWWFGPSNGDPCGYAACTQCMARTARKLGLSQGVRVETEQETGQ